MRATVLFRHGQEYGPSDRRSLFGRRCVCGAIKARLQESVSRGIPAARQQRRADGVVGRVRLTWDRRARQDSGVGDRYQMTRKRVTYNGHIIEAHPHLLRNDGRWSTDFDIERHDGSGYYVRPYSGERTHDTPDAAIEHCLRLGSLIIDGRIQPRSVA
jgi:hypothetical protein